MVKGQGVREDDGVVKGVNRGKEASAPPHPDSKDGEGEGGADLATATLQLVCIRK